MSISSLLTLCGIDELLCAIQFFLEMWISERLVDNDIHGALEESFHMHFEVHELLKGSGITFAVKLDQEVYVAMSHYFTGRKRTENMQALHTEAFAGFKHFWILGEINHRSEYPLSWVFSQYGRFLYIVPFGSNATFGKLSSTVLRIMTRQAI
jgi:hypothetical protein